MLNENDWVQARVTEAKQQHPLVTESVSTHMEKLLKISLGERQLSQSELKTVAKDLIARMVPARRGAEATQ